MSDNLNANGMARPRRTFGTVAKGTDHEAKRVLQPSPVSGTKPASPKRLEEARIFPERIPKDRLRDKNTILHYNLSGEIEEYPFDPSVLERMGGYHIPIFSPVPSEEDIEAFEKAMDGEGLFDGISL